jgi:hypothetical protein
LRLRQVQRGLRLADAFCLPNRFAGVSTYLVDLAADLHLRGAE